MSDSQPPLSHPLPSTSHNPLHTSDSSPSTSDPSENCVFCHIVKGKVPAKKVYEDDVVLALLDIYPAAQGHVIVVPKRHAQILPQLDEKELAHLGITAKVLSQAILKSFDCKGTSLVVQNGAAAGQRAPHVILHIIPRVNGDGIFLNPELVTLSATEQDELLSSVKKGTAGNSTQSIPSSAHSMPKIDQSKTSHTADLDELAELMK